MAPQSSGPTEEGLSLEARIEGLLFVSPEPLTIDQLAAALQVPPRLVEKALETLSSEYGRRGIRVQRHDSRVQLTTAPEMAGEVERLLGLQLSAHLTQAAVEVLAIVAYQQPVTRPHIDSIRGVNSDSVLRTLLRHGLIEEAGRSEGPGRPILYVTTPTFLQHFGLTSLGELPPLGLGALDAASGEATGEPTGGDE